MKELYFKAKTRKTGNSTVITIPKALFSPELLKKDVTYVWSVKQEVDTNDKNTKDNIHR